jgi:Transcription factor zinc-finger
MEKPKMSYDGKKTEDEWFVRHESEMLEGLKRERVRREKEMAELMKQEEARKRKELHWMKCPKCGSDLKEEDVTGITIDKCTFCEGIFLDRNELDELLLKRDHEKQSFLGRVFSMFSSKAVPVIPGRTHIELTRTAVRARRQEIVAQAMDLTEEEAAKFWPLYTEYRKEVSKENDKEMEIIFSFVKNYSDISQGQAGDIQNELLEIQKTRLSLKEKYIQEFRNALPPKKVARYFEIEFKLDAILNYDLAETIPLVETKS